VEKYGEGEYSYVDRLNGLSLQERTIGSSNGAATADVNEDSILFLLHS
jgi:hypothetical protein